MDEDELAGSDTLLADPLAWLDATPLAAAVREWPWLYPAAETTHLLGIVLLVGAAALFDLRLLGLSRSLPVSTLARHLLPWSRVGLALVVPTGVLMFVSDAVQMAANPVFRLKLVVIVFAGLNAWTFHRWPLRSVVGWDCDAPSPPSARIVAVASLVLWTSAIVAGRLIAYV